MTTPASDAVDANLPQPLLVSSVNGGGVFLMSGGRVERLSQVDTTGMATFRGGYLWARQCEGPAEFRWLRADGAEPVVLTQEHLDLHDILAHDGALYVVATATNTVVELDDQTLGERQRWVFPGRKDSQHINSVCIHDGRLLASRFGTWEAHRGYKGHTRGAGQVFDVRTGEVLLDGLSQPHSLKSRDGLLWLCDSEAHRLRAFREFRAVVDHALPGYARGLAFSGPFIYVGLSRSRNDASDGVDRATVLALDAEALEEVARWTLPADEVYEIVPTSMPREAVLRAALAESQQEADRIRHQRHVADAGLAHAAEREAALQARVDAAGAALARAEAERARAERLAEEATLWARCVAGEAAALRQRLDAQAAAIAPVMAEMELASHRRGWRWAGRRGTHAVATVAHALEALQPLAVAPPVPVSERAAVPVLGLAFKHADAPIVTVVVVADAGFAQTRRCLEALQASGDRTPFEVVVVDTGGDGECRRFATVPGVVRVESDHAAGAAGAARRALEVARGGRLAFIGGSAQACLGWLDALSSTFDLLPGCALVGAHVYAPDGVLLEAGRVVRADGSIEPIGADAPRRGAVGEVDSVSGAALMVDAGTFRAIGGFDGGLGNGRYGVADLAFRVRARGLRAFMQPRAGVVADAEGADDETSGRQLFVERWRDTLQAEQLPPGAHPALARERGQLRRNVLVIDRFPPETDRDAGSRAIWQLLRVLLLQGANVRFWSAECGRSEGYAEALRVHGIETAGSGEDGFEDWIASHGACLDAVIVSRPMVGHVFMGAVRRHTPARRVYYGHDIHYLRLLGHHRVSGEPGLHTQANDVREVEHRLWRQSDVVLYPTGEETAEVAGWLRAHDVDAIAATIPLFAYEDVPEPGSVAGPGERTDILFVGGFQHAPNADAARWFADAVWPRLRERHPGARLCLVGADPPPELAALAGADVLVPGHVSDAVLQQHHAQARVVVAPLRFGAGLKGKLLEAMRYGVPCVTTQVGAQGLGDAACIAVADAPDAMAEAVSRLMEDDAAWTEAARAGLAYVAARFSVEAVWSVLGPALGEGRGAAAGRTREAAMEGQPA